MKKFLVILAIALALFAMGCTAPSTQGEPTTGILLLKITDKQVEGLQELNLTISSIQVHIPDYNAIDSNSEGWYTISETEKTFDLMKLSGVAEILGSAELPTGKYTQIRLTVKEASAKIDGNTYSVTVPSDKVKLVRQFTIEADKTTELVIDFSPESLIKAGEDYKLQPVIQILTKSEFESKKEQAVCGNSEKEIGENCSTCPEDMTEGECSVCGNSERESGENCRNCPQDMPTGTCTEEVQGDIPSGTGDLLLLITDAKSVDYDALWVTISGVDVHTAEEGWVQFSDATKTFDIMKLAGVTDVIDQNSLKAGHYTQIRLTVTDANVDVNGVMYSVKVPSDKIKLVNEFTISDGNVLELVLDFKPESVKLAGGKYIMTPVIKVISPKDVNKEEEPEEECGNGEADENESCSNCPADIHCDANKLCCTGNCITPTCTSNAQCDDSNASTVDVCTNPNTCTSACTHTAALCGNAIVDANETCTSCPADVVCDANKLCCTGTCTTPVCDTNSDCDDSNSSTTDTCTNPNTCTAACSHETINLCGNAVVDAGENCSTCPADVACDTNSQTCCTGVCHTIACKINTDCDDTNAYTTDTCTDSNNWCISVCSHT